MILHIVYVNTVLDCEQNDCEVLDELPNDIKIINFTAGGGNLMYQLGIARFIQEQYDLQNMCFVGTSSGTASSLCLANNINVDRAVNESIRNIFIDCKRHSYFGNVNRVCNSIIIHTQKYIGSLTGLQNCNHRLFLAVSQVGWFGLRKKYLTGGSFNSIAVGCSVSAWIPFITCPMFKPLVNLNGRYYVDGCLSGFRDNVNKKNMLVISPNVFVKRPLYTYWVWLDLDYNMREYKAGYNDASTNRKQLDDFLGSRRFPEPLPFKGTELATSPAAVENVVSENRIFPVFFK